MYTAKLVCLPQWDLEFLNIGDSNICTELEILRVQVPIIFLGTVGF